MPTLTTDLLNYGQDLQFFAETPSRVLEVAGWLLDGPLTLAELVCLRLAKRQHLDDVDLPAIPEEVAA